VYFLRANIEGEVWLIVSEWEFQGRIWWVCQNSNFISTAEDTNFKFCMHIDCKGY